MKIWHKIVLIVFLPMLILSAYQFYSIEKTFDKIEEARSKIFIQSASEIKYASDVLQLTSLLNSNLFEVYIATSLRDEQADKAINQYREVKLVRYHSLQKLKESVLNSDAEFLFFQHDSDLNKLNEINKIENKIKEVDAINESLLLQLSFYAVGAADDNTVHDLLAQSNALTRMVSEDLLIYTNREYVMIGETSRKVTETEKEGKSTLLTVFVVGYVLAFFIVIFFHQIVVRPIEKFVHVIETKDWEKGEWTALDNERNDEIGVVHRQIREWMNLPKSKPHDKSKKKPRKERKSSPQVLSKS